MIGLVAQDALVENILCVQVNDRANDAERPARGAVCAVFEPAGTDTESRDGFVGLVAAHQIVRGQGKTFGDLLPPQPPEPIAGNASLPEVLKRLRVAAVEALPVLDENFNFLGAISQRSILDALLKRERELLK